jgi:hypothetical protein
VPYLGKSCKQDSFEEARSHLGLVFFLLRAMLDRAKFSKHTVSMMNPGKQNLAGSNAGEWVPKLESIVKELLHNLEQFAVLQFRNHQ